MKKIIICGVCALMSLGAFAQETVLKEAKKAVGKQSYEEVMKILAPAMKDPATANNPETYFLAGKAGFEYYKKLEKKAQVDGQMSEADGVASSKALLGCYDNFMKALELGTKEQGNIVKMLTEKYEAFNNAGVYFYNAQNFKDAYRCWDIYLTLPESKYFASNKLLATMLTPEKKIDLYYNEGIAAWQAEEYMNCYNAMNNSIEAGNTSKTPYDYALYSALQLKDPALIKAAAERAYKVFGKEDSQYIGQIINGYLDEKNFTEALNLIDEAIATYPETSQYYFIKGYILEQDEVKGDPIPMYEKAIALDPQNDTAIYELGYYLLKQVDQISDSAPVDPAEYKVVKEQQIDPLLRQAVSVLENAYKVKLAKDADLHDCEVLLKNAYYNLGEDPDAKILQLQ